jgi:broad specificity phosphatase PhoE
MPPILHLMRHGQGYHSAEVTKDGHLLHDPELTPKGIEQCKARCAAFDRHDHVRLPPPPRPCLAPRTTEIAS